MGLLSRMKILWLGMWSNVIGAGEKNIQLTAQGAIENHKKNKTKIQNALASLIFQRMKTEDRLTAIRKAMAGLAADIDQAAILNRDELALNLMLNLKLLKMKNCFWLVS